MKINNYDENRDFFRRVANESQEERKKIRRINSLKYEADGHLDQCISNSVSAALLVVVAILSLRGNVVVTGIWKYIVAIGAGLLASYLGGSEAIKEYKQRKANINEANKLIEEVIQNNDLYGKTL